MIAPTSLLIRAWIGIALMRSARFVAELLVPEWREPRHRGPWDRDFDGRRA